jgi:hypothetical protein
VSDVRIGIDFDNTIICYDKVFTAAAHRRGLLPRGWTGSKTDVRDYLQSKPGGDVAWQGLQGFVYGKGIGGAEIYPGVRDFLASCRQARSDVYVVSHKTRFGHQDPDRVDLREAARNWLRATGLIGTEGSPLSSDAVYFEDTQAAKVDRLASLDLDVFIDDLVDVFEQPHFPRRVLSILFDSSGKARAGPCKPMANWEEIRREVFAR